MHFISCYLICMSRSYKLKEYLFKRYGQKCVYCNVGVTFDTVRIEHFLPFVICRTNRRQNLVPSCPLCNQTKGALVFNLIYDASQYILAKRDVHPLGLSLSDVPQPIRSFTEVAKILQTFMSQFSVDEYT